MTLKTNRQAFASRWVHKSGIAVPLIMILCLIFSGIFTNGCTMVGPDTVQPKAPVPEKWMESDDARIATEPIDYTQWWEVFRDETLNELIETAYKQNLTLQIAGIRILEARAQLGIAIGELYPQTQQARGETSRNRISENQANTSPGLDKSYWDYSTGFDAAWELDFWGKFRRAVEAGVANLEASIADYDTFLVSLLAEVAQTYVSIRTTEQRLAYAEDNAAIQKESLRIATARFKGGLVTELDVTQARTLLETTLATIPSFLADMRTAKNSLAILLGLMPHEVDALLVDVKPIPSVPPKVLVDIPADLLRRRPDIQLAELQIATQSPLIGVAKADLYPRFTLLGSIGLRSSDSSQTKAGDSGFSDMFESDSFELFAGPSIEWNLFNYGRIKNRVRVEDARLEQLIVNYKDTVLKAYQEVEDALVGFLRRQEEEGFLINSVKASRRSVELSQQQYLEGLVDYQRVLDAQRSLSELEDGLSIVTGSVATNLIAMYKALGGGWQIREGQDFVAAEYKEAMRNRTDWGRLLSPETLEPLATPEDRKKWRWPDW